MSTRFAPSSAAAAPEPPPSAAGVALALHLRDDVELRADDAGGLSLIHVDGALRLGGLRADERAVLQRLALAPLMAGDLPGSRRIADALTALEPWLCRTVTLGQRALATAVPMAPSAVLRPSPPCAARTAVGLSRFAYLRRDGHAAEALLESPLVHHRIQLHDPAAAALAAVLATPRPVALAAQAVPDLPLAAVAALADVLMATGLAEGEDSAEAASSQLALWDFHDLLFHARSRSGRHDHLFGGTFAHLETHPPLPAVRPAHPEALIELPTPTWEEVLAADPTLTEALEGRRSIREYGQAPITLVELGTVLYRAARARRVIAAQPDAGLPYDALERPFPTGGASGELELYATVAACRGLDPGAYHYDAAAHGLRRLAASERDCRALLEGARRATAGRVSPQVLLTITARFGRVSWKYSSIAYALTLKHVGALYQTLYLVATAMGLAPCALGSGDSDAAVRAFGLEWASESSVGEFLLGARPQLATTPAAGFADLVAATRAA